MTRQGSGAMRAAERIVAAQTGSFTGRPVRADL